jgi:acyl carrier protein
MKTALIDIDLSGYSTKDIEGIYEELKFSVSHKKVAFRNGRRWVSYFEKLPSAEASQNQVLKNKGVYLMTGDLDDTEYTIAAHLLKSFEANVVLFSTLTKEENESEPKKVQLNKLQKLPGNFTLRQVNITDLNEYKSAVEEVENEFGTIQGIFHMAKNSDINDIALVGELSEDTISKHFALRTNGLINTDQIFSEKSPDFIRVVSSLSSMVGGITYGAYATAAALMDGVALHHQKSNCNLGVINLDRVYDEDPWIRQDELAAILNHSFIYDEVNQLVVSKRDIHKPLKLSGKEESKSRVNAKLNRKTLKVAYKAPQSATEKQVLVLFEELFGVKGIGMEDDFFELGGDSLKAMVLVNRLKKEMAVEITISDMFSNKNAEDLALLIDERKWLMEDKNQVHELII